MSKYPNSNTEPETLRQMAGMMSPKPAALIGDPTTIATDRLFRIYMDMKSKVLLGDKQPDSVAEALREARDRTIKEVAMVKLRNNAVAKYDQMLERLTAGGEIQI